MDIDNVIEELIKLPLSVPDKSVYARLKETGYFEIHDKILVGDIRKAINEHPDRVFIIKWWMQYSEDKRCLPGWYFKRKTDTEYIIGYINEEAISNLYEEEYEDGLDACTSFIKHEIDEINKQANLHRRK